MVHLALAELEAGLDEIRRSPADHGIVELIVRRPAIGEREVLREAELDLEVGLVGDNWKVRGSRSTPDRSAKPDAQLTVVNARAMRVIAPDHADWPLAGDQLFIDLDLRDDNLTAGDHLAIGTAVIVVTDDPHRGCAQYRARFGDDAFRFVRSPAGQELHLRGIHARVVVPGLVRHGDVAHKLPGDGPVVG